MRTKIVVSSVYLPAFLATALINGDVSSLTDYDTVILGKTYAWLSEQGLKLTSLVEGSERFANISTPFAFRGDVAEYVTYKEVAS